MQSLHTCWKNSEELRMFTRSELTETLTTLLQSVEPSSKETRDFKILDKLTPTRSKLEETSIVKPQSAESSFKEISSKSSTLTKLLSEETSPTALQSVEPSFKETLEAPRRSQEEKEDTDSKNLT